MAEEFNENVEIQGSQDVTQLRVQGHTSQTQPLQEWQNSAGDPLARVTGDGRLQVGDFDPLDQGAMATTDSLIEAHRDVNSAKPRRGLHLLGRVGGAVTDAITWAMHELELVGGGAVSGLHSVIQARLIHTTSGNAEQATLVTGYFEGINQSGNVSAPVGQMASIRAVIVNGETGYLDEAIAVDVAVTQDGSVTDQIGTAYGVRIQNIDSAVDNYALHTGQGTIHLGDDLELKLFDTTPATNAPTDYIKLYAKLDGGQPQLYSKDAHGVEHVLGGVGTGDMTRAVYDPNDNGVVDAAESVPWSGVTDKPGTFWPDVHTHLDTANGGLLTSAALTDFTGMVIPFAGSTPPDGWLVCDGAEVSRTAQADLFAVIGTQYGAGDGTSTFNLPDLRGRFPVGPV